MFTYKDQFLPELVDSFAVSRENNNKKLSEIEKSNKQDKTVQTQTISPYPPSTSSKASFCSTSQKLVQAKRKPSDQSSTSRQPNLDLPPVVANSTLVHQRATAGDHLAAASVTTGASLPLMIGGRSKCVVNILESPSTGQQEISFHQDLPTTNQPIGATGPQNTALRAEQRRQNMSVSIVRPVINTTNQNHQSQNDGYSTNSSVYRKLPGESSPSAKCSLIDDLMNLDRRLSASGGNSENILDQLILSTKLGKVNLTGLSLPQQYLKSEQEQRHQALMLRREEHELNRGIKRQHHFVLSKIEERRRHLQIIQSVWVQKDFKHAIEKLVDIYHQGLIFTNDLDTTQNKRHRGAQLNSLNTSLVVDVIVTIILRPKLWTLEICQLLLPIIINDLLMQTAHEYYIEVALKALKLILTHFSPVIKSTLESLKDSSKQIGVDISREDRINKCLSCYKLLLEAHSIVASRRNDKTTGSQCKVGALYRELQTLFVSIN